MDDYRHWIRVVGAWSRSSARLVLPVQWDHKKESAIRMEGGLGNLSRAKVRSFFVLNN